MDSRAVLTKSLLFGVLSPLISGNVGVALSSPVIVDFNSDWLGFISGFALVISIVDTKVGRTILARLQTATSSALEYSIISVHKLLHFMVPIIQSYTKNRVKTRL